MLLIGIDWADTEHVYCLMDETGATLATGTIEYTAEGLERFMALVRGRVQTPQDFLVALGTSQGPLVGALLDQQFTVYAINPKAVDRHRERFRVAGAKSDLRDAWVLATLLRALQAVSPERLEGFLRRQHCPRSRDWAAEIHARMQARGFHIAPPIVRTKARLAGTLASQLQTLSRHHERLFAVARTGLPRSSATKRSPCRRRMTSRSIYQECFWRGRGFSMARAIRRKSSARSRTTPAWGHIEAIAE